MTPGRVLVADDSRLARTLVRRELEALGYAVDEAADGAEALAGARVAAPDVILLDVEMPVLDGFQTLAILRDEPALADIPVVFLTGIDDSATAARGLAAGAHDYLRKPFQSVELGARVAAAHRTKRLQDELRWRNAQLAALAQTDALTGLANRRHATEQLDLLVSRCRRHGTALSVVLIDVDRFKSINDTLGHAGGDQVLVEVSERMRSRIRAEDLIARWGGEEFLVVLPDVQDAGAAAVAESLRALVAEQPCLIDGDPRPVTISGGWATWDGHTVEELVHAADEGLYAAKAAGRDAVRGAGRPVAPLS